MNQITRNDLVVSAVLVLIVLMMHGLELLP